MRIGCCILGFPLLAIYTQQGGWYWGTLLFLCMTGALLLPEDKDNHEEADWPVRRGPLGQEHRR